MPRELRLDRSSAATALALLLLGAPACREPNRNPKPAAGAAPAAAPVTGRPAIACDEPRFDLGVVPAGGEATHVFKVRNQGDRPLKLERAQGG